MDIGDEIDEYMCRDGCVAQLYYDRIASFWMRLTEGQFDSRWQHTKLGGDGVRFGNGCNYPFLRLRSANQSWMSLAGIPPALKDTYYRFGVGINTFYFESEWSSVNDFYNHTGHANYGDDRAIQRFTRGMLGYFRKRVRRWLL